MIDDTLSNTFLKILYRKWNFPTSASLVNAIKSPEKWEFAHINKMNSYYEALKSKLCTYKFIKISNYIFWVF